MTSKSDLFARAQALRQQVFAGYSEKHGIRVGDVIMFRMYPESIPAMAVAAWVDTDGDVLMVYETPDVNGHGSYDYLIEADQLASIVSRVGDAV